MSGEAIVFLVLALAILDVAGLGALLYFKSRRDAAKARIQSDVQSKVRPLSASSQRQHRERLLGEVDLAIEDGRYETALEKADNLLADVLTERGFPEKTYRRKKALGTALHAIDHEMAGAYAGARTNRSFASGALRSEKEEQIEKAAFGYRYVCEALIDANDGRDP